LEDKKTQFRFWAAESLPPQLRRGRDSGDCLLERAVERAERGHEELLEERDRVADWLVVP